MASRVCLGPPALCGPHSGIIIVAGKYRSGKSFLMNQMTQARTMEGEGFSVGHTIATHTKGIWMLPRAIEGRTAAGEKVDMLVMDSEGLGALEQVSPVPSVPGPRARVHACPCTRGMTVLHV
jgi:hypothetical protein